MKKCLCVLLALTMLITCMPLMAMADNNLAFDMTKVTIFEGETFQLALNMSDEVAAGELSYVSGAPRVAKVDENGLVTGLTAGKATITARVKVGKRTYSANASITVNRAVTEIVMSNEKSLNLKAADDPSLDGLLMMSEPPMDIEDPSEWVDPLAELPVLVTYAGKDVELSASARPTNASDRGLTYATMDETVARIVNTRVLRPVAPGETMLVVSSKSNPEVTLCYRVLVVKPVTKVEVTADTKVVFVGGVLPLNAVITPDDATMTDVTWSSEQPSIATVDENGLVYGVKRGEVTIRATANDGSKRVGRITLRVQQRPESVTLDKYELTLPVGTSKSLKATVLPNNTSDRTVVWTSSDPSVAKVNSNGYVTPVSRGFCVITCASKVAPEIYAECMVNVTQPVTRIKFTESTVTVNVNEAASVHWNVEPFDASNNSVTLTSANTKIATVDQNGVIYGVKRGETTITAKANDGSGKSGRITVKVLQPVYGVHMKNDSAGVGVNETASITAVLEPSDASNKRMRWYSSDERIVTVSGNGTTPKLTGKAWGYATVTGITEDGGYSTSCYVRVGNYDKALKITDLYLQNNAVKIGVRNESDMNVSSFTFDVELYDAMGNPVPCNYNGTNVLSGSYSLPLYPGDNTTHGRFNFGNGFVQPEQRISRLVMYITGYRTDDGYRRSIDPVKRTAVEYKAPDYVGPTAPEGEDGETSSETVYPYTAVTPVALSLYENNTVSLALMNTFTQTVNRMVFTIELYDVNDNPIVCNDEGTNVISGINNHALKPNAITEHGSFNFVNYVQPTTPIHYCLLRVTGYLLANGKVVEIPLEEQPYMEYRSVEYTGEGHVALPETTETANNDA